MKRKKKNAESYHETIVLDKEELSPADAGSITRLVAGSPGVDGLAAVVILASLGLWDADAAMDYEGLSDRPATGPLDGSGGIPSTGPVTPYRHHIKDTNELRL